MEAEGKVILVTNAKQRSCQFSWFGCTNALNLMPGMYTYFMDTVLTFSFWHLCQDVGSFTFSLWINGLGKMSSRSLKQVVLIPEFLISTLVKKKCMH